MNIVPQLAGFFAAIREDSRINPVHISLFMAIIQRWKDNGYKSPICIFSRDLMSLAKISGVATYHKSIRELHKYGYIRYEPSYDHFSGSLVYIK